jgi:hypothetical protein
MQKEVKRELMLIVLKSKAEFIIIYEKKQVHVMRNVLSITIKWMGVHAAKIKQKGKKTVRNAVQTSQYDSIYKNAK